MAVNGGVFTTEVGGGLPTLIHMSIPSRIALAAFNRMEYCFVLGRIGRGTIFCYTLVVVNCELNLPIWAEPLSLERGNTMVNGMRSLHKE